MMHRIHAAFLITELLFLAWLPLGAFCLDDHWHERHTNNLVNYVAVVGTDVLIMAPIMPAPVGIRWFSLNMGGELPRGGKDEVSLATSGYVEKFEKTYNTSWKANAFKTEKLNRWLLIQNVRLSYADVFRVYVADSGSESKNQAVVNKPFDVAITLMTYENHECGFSPKPEDPKVGDTLTLSCSVIVNGPWNTSFVFRNYFDGSETKGEVSECGQQPSIGSKICSAVTVKTTTNVFGYSCNLRFASSDRHEPKDPMFQNSAWTAVFNELVVCNFPRIYLKSIPSNASFLCNNKPCRDTAFVNDTVTCEVHGYPKPVVDIHIKDVSTSKVNKSKSRDFEMDHENRFIIKAADKDKVGSPNHTQWISPHKVHGSYGKVTVEKFTVSGEYRFRQRDVGQVEITCNASNAIGWEGNVLVLEIKLKREADAVTGIAHSDVEAAAAGGDFLYQLSDMAVRCNDHICKNNEVMRIGDSVSCYYDAKIIEGPVYFVLRINHFEKRVEKPCVYKLRAEDVNKQLVQCIGYTEVGVLVLEINMTVVCAFRYPHGDPHHLEDYDYVAQDTKGRAPDEVIIVCNDAPCNRPGRTVYTGTVITCRYTDNRAAYLNMSVNDEKVKHTISMDNIEAAYELKRKDYGPISVKCYNSIANVLAAVTFRVELWPCGDDFESGEAAGALDVLTSNFGAAGQKNISGRVYSTDAGLAAGSIDVPTSHDGFNPAENPGRRIPDGAEKSKHDVGSNGPERFALLQLLLLFIGVIVGQVQF